MSWGGFPSKMLGAFPQVPEEFSLTNEVAATSEEGPCKTMANTYYNGASSSSRKRPMTIYLGSFTGEMDPQTFWGLLEGLSWRYKGTWRNVGGW